MRAGRTVHAGGTVVELVRPGWRAPRELADRVVLAPEGVTISIDGRSRRLAGDELAGAEVWRAPDGHRWYRLLDRTGATTAVLADHLWRLPRGGRLAPLLTAIGCPVRSRAAPDDPALAPVERVAAAAGPRTRILAWLAGAGVAVTLLALSAGVAGAPSTRADAWVDELAAAVVPAVACYLGLLVVQWRRRDLGSGVRLVVRPTSGERAGWVQRAGLRRLGGAVVANDGWGRAATWAAQGPCAVAAVAAVGADVPGAGASVGAGAGTSATGAGGGAAGVLPGADGGVDSDGPHGHAGAADPGARARTAAVAAPDALGAVVLLDAEGRAAARLPLAT